MTQLFGHTPGLRYYISGLRVIFINSFISKKMNIQAKIL